jgi:hypothetical protein
MRAACSIVTWIVCARWFERFGVQADAARLSADVWQRFLTARL